MKKDLKNYLIWKKNICIIYMIETIIISCVSVLGFCFGCFSLVKYTYHYAAVQCRTLWKCRKWIIISIYNVMCTSLLKSLPSSAEVESSHITGELQNMLPTATIARTARNLVILGDRVWSIGNSFAKCIRGVRWLDRPIRS